MSWIPKRTFAETDAILCSPGMPHEVETRLIDGQVQRVYKNLWPSLRDFWIFVSKEYKDRTYIVFEQQRWTYGQIAERAVKAASVYQTVYGIQKGDRVAICSRNFPDFLVAWWACHLLGAVSVMVNAWLLLPALHGCFVNTQSKLIIVDAERADRIESIATKLRHEAGTTGILVLESHEGKGKWEGMRSWNHVINNYSGNAWKVLDYDPRILPEDNATVIFSSGTTGAPKGVLSTHRSFLTNVRNISVGSTRAVLRSGLENAKVPDGPPKGVLIAVPLFHVIGITSLAMTTSLNGMKIVLMRKWTPEEGFRLINRENIAIAGGVPTIVSDLIEGAPSSDCPLGSIIFGGAPVDKRMPEKARKAFPNALVGQAYGMTECNSIAVTIAGEDYARRPTSTGLPSPVNDILIVHEGKSLPVGQVGEIWLRGPNVMKEYWGDPVATARTLTKDGWLRTGDLGLLDEDGLLYVRDRIKDMIISGGENIDSVSVENALYEDPRVLEVVAVGVPDERLGEVVAAVVRMKQAFRGQVSEEELMEVARKSLPKFAVPAVIIIRDEQFERTPTEKTIKGELRDLARAEWARRCSVAVDTPRYKL